MFTGIELGRYNRVLSHTPSPCQLAAGDDRRITFGISLARDAIYAANKRKEGCGLADNDFEAAFDFLCLEWVKQVLRKKGIVEAALDRFSNLYKDGITIPVINNVPGKPIANNRLSLRQGDRPSGIWFFYGIDPLLVYQVVSFTETQIRISARSLYLVGGRVFCSRRIFPSSTSRSLTTWTTWVSSSTLTTLPPEGRMESSSRRKSEIRLEAGKLGTSSN